MGEPFDLVILGAGPGGYVAAIRATQRGARVALVEKDRIGGTCLNRGCIPTKTLQRDAEIYREAASGQFCIECDTPLRVNVARLMARKQQVVDQLVGGVTQILKAHKVELISGTGCVEEPGLVKVHADDGERALECRAILLATGSLPHKPPIPGLDLPGVMTTDQLLALEALPTSVVVIGASTVGAEFACLLNALGVRVCMVERLGFLKYAEPQLARRMRTLLAQRGIDIHTEVEVQRVDVTDQGRLCVHYVDRGKAAFAEGEIVLVATGRVPNTRGLGLESLGVALNGAAIAVDEHLETNQPGIWAIGDCIGGYMLAHVASYEAEVAVDNILGGHHSVDYSVVPSCIFTLPEIAGVGLTEGAAREKGLDVVVTRFPFGANGRALALGEAEGQIRLICERRGDGRGGRMLGAFIMGPHASDLIAEATLAIRLGATAEDIAATIHAHPTVPEALMEAAMAQGLGAIHFQNR